MQMTVKCVLEVVYAAADKPKSVWNFDALQILGVYCSPSLSVLMSE